MHAKSRGYSVPIKIGLKPGEGAARGLGDQGGNRFQSKSPGKGERSPSKESVTVNSSAQRTDAQVQYETADAIVVVDFKSREQWKRAFDAVALQRKYPPRACVLMSRLADHFNCKTGQCNPSFDTLAQEMGVTERTVRRAIDDIEPDGWILTKRGGRTDKLSFTLCFPDPIPDSMLSGMDDSHTGHHAVHYADDPYRTDSASIPDTMVAAHKEQTNRQEGGPPARPYSVPVESLVIEPVTMRAPEGAQANPVEREEPEMLTPEQKDAVAELLQDRWTPRELADAAGCPSDVPIMHWLAKHGLAERAGNGWKFRIRQWVT
jgi:helix-turn-helix protein